MAIMNINELNIAQKPQQSTLNKAQAQAPAFKAQVSTDSFVSSAKVSFKSATAKENDLALKVRDIRTSLQDLYKKSNLLLEKNRNSLSEEQKRKLSKLKTSLDEAAIYASSAIGSLDASIE